MCGDSVSKSYYKYSMEYYLNDNYIRSIDCRLLESKVDILKSEIKAPLGDCLFDSLGGLFAYDTLKDEGITFKFFFETIERFLGEGDVIFNFSIDLTSLHIETQRFTDRFYRIVEVYDFEFLLDKNCKSLLEHKKFYGRLKDILFKFKIKETECLNNAHNLMEEQGRLRAMYECSFNMFDDYIKNGKVELDNTSFSIEDFIGFCSDDTFRNMVVLDYYEKYKDSLFKDKELNNMFSEFMFFTSLGVINVKNNLKKKFMSMISDIKAKYFVMGYDDEHVPTLKS